MCAILQLVSAPIATPTLSVSSENFQKITGVSDFLLFLRVDPFSFQCYRSEGIILDIYKALQHTIIKAPYLCLVVLSFQKGCFTAESRNAPQYSYFHNYAQNKKKVAAAASLAPYVRFVNMADHFKVDKRSVISEEDTR